MTSVDDLGDLVSLVDRARSRDPDAWEALYRRAYPGLVAYASRRLGADRGRDAVAETMARAVAGIDRFEWRGSGFDGWLYGILRHVVVDAQRSQTRRRVERNGTDVSTDPGPLDYVVQGEEAEAVRQAFSALGADFGSGSSGSSGSGSSGPGSGSSGPGPGSDHPGSGNPGSGSGSGSPDSRSGDESHD